ncbi:MAG: aldo/keto reductase [Oscillospiraceae bacterium]|nr:aldo/keto reductase [Oscillospiraceae bacterium]
MKKIILGATGIEVTELCFGALPMGPLQKNMTINESAEVVAEALRLGITFIDTAQAYKTYAPIRLAMEQTGMRPVIATKSTASTYEDMEAAIWEARENLGLDVIDIFLLHAARVENDVFETRRGALECLLDYKRKDVIRAVGISTHVVQTVRAAAENSDIDIVFPLLNKTGMGILGGKREDMEHAVNECFARHKAVYLMKALAGGTLIGDYIDSMDYARNFAKERAAIAVGMVSPEEVRMNVQYFNGVDISEQAGKLTKSAKRFYIVPSLCKDCGSCAKACHSGMINGSPPVIDDSGCLRCGYCVAACPQFAIRMI